VVDAHIDGAIGGGDQGVVAGSALVDVFDEAWGLHIRHCISNKRWEDGKEESTIRWILICKEIKHAKEVIDAIVVLENIASYARAHQHHCGKERREVHLVK
jgi:uncharacterized protein (UPF0276 family)